MFALFTHSILMRILFISSQIFLQSVFALNETTCISSYDEMKQALLKEGTGNMERLLYAFAPPNLPLPHYMWVYYFHNQSSEWSNILTCPSSNSFTRCPGNSTSTISKRAIDNSSYEDPSIYHVLFWADSSLLIKLDIPVLKLLSYNCILQYLGKGSCVQLVIPPFCENVDPDLEKEILEFVTSYLRSYSASSQESERDYVLICDEKFDTEFAYDAYLLGSEIIICVGSGFLFVFLSLKLCSTLGDKDKEKDYIKKLRSVFKFPYHKQEVKEDSGKEKEDTGIEMEDAKKEKEDKQSKDTEENDEKFQGKDEPTQTNKEQESKTDNLIRRHKKYFSAVLIINICTILFLITDTIQFSLQPDVVQDAFLYGYGAINIVLFGIACVSVLIKLTCVVMYLIAKVSHHLDKHKNNKVFLYITLVLSTTLTLASFLYILSRAFLIALAFATYPFDVGFILLTIGSGLLALLFVIWASVHIAVHSYSRSVNWCTIIVSLVPYGAMLIILTGFLLSYIYVILRVNIRLADPVTSLVSALVPGSIAFVAGKRYDKELQIIKKGELNEEENNGGEHSDSQQSTTANQLSSEEARPLTKPTNNSN